MSLGGRNVKPYQKDIITSFNPEALIKQFNIIGRSSGSPRFLTPSRSYEQWLWFLENTSEVYSCGYSLGITPSSLFTSSKNIEARTKYRANVKTLIETKRC